MTDHDDPAWEGRAEQLSVHSLLKMIFAVLVLLLFLLLVSFLPGLDQTIPGLPITVTAIVSALIAVIIALLLLHVAPQLQVFVREILAVPDEIATPAAAIAYWLTIFLTVIVAYEGLAPVIRPILVETGLVWAYELAFFFIGVVPLLLIAYYCAQILDPVTEHFVEKIRVETEDQDSSNRR